MRASGHVWKWCCIGLAIVLLVLAVNLMVKERKYNNLHEEYISLLRTDWYRLYRMTEIVDKQLIQSHDQDPDRLRLMVNQISHNYSGRPDEISVNMRNLLVLAYDPLFQDLSRKEGPLNEGEAYKLLREMNDAILVISRSISSVPDDQLERRLLDLQSSEYIELNSYVKLIHNQFVQSVDEYFRHNAT